MSIAPPNARRNVGVQRMSSGSSTMPMRSRSRQNASIRGVLGATEVEQVVGRPGARPRSRRAPPRTSATVLVGTRFAGSPGRPELAREPDHLAADGLVFALGRGQDAFRRQRRRSASCSASCGRTDRAQGGPRHRLPAGRPPEWLRQLVERRPSRSRGALEPRPKGDDGRVVDVRAEASASLDQVADARQLLDRRLGLEPPDRPPRPGADERRLRRFRDEGIDSRRAARRSPADRPAARTPARAGRTGRRRGGTPRPAGSSDPPGARARRTVRRRAPPGPGPDRWLRRRSTGRIESANVAVQSLDEGDARRAPGVGHIRPAAVVAVVADGGGAVGLTSKNASRKAANVVGKADMVGV